MKETMHVKLHYYLVIILRFTTISDLGFVESYSVKFPENPRFTFLSIVSQNSVRLISSTNKSFNERLWVSRLEYILQGASSYSSDIHISIMDRKDDSLNPEIGDKNNNFVEHLVLFACNSISELRSSIINHLSHKTKVICSINFN